MMSKAGLWLRKLFTACSLFFSWLSKITYRSSQEKEVDRWFQDDGDRTLRVNYDLDRESLVFDLGGYEGDWSAEIAARYGCRIFVFEPVHDYANRIIKRFRRNDMVRVFSFGLGSGDITQMIHIAEEGSSLFASPNVPRRTTDVAITIRAAADFFSELKVERVDLMKINIEGGEYDLLEHLIDTGLIASVRSIQVQFHDFVPQAESRRLKIREKLLKTHACTYEYKFVWENWEKR